MKKTIGCFVGGCRLFDVRLNVDLVYFNCAPMF